MTEFMISLREAGSGAVGPARYLTFDGEGPDNTLTFDAWAAAIVAQFPAVPNPAGNPQRTGDILFLCHGFNVSHDAAKSFHLECVAGLRAAGWTGQLVSYDWPSDGLVFAYLPDRANARAAASTLVTGGIALLEKAQRADCTLNVHVLAHSMGCFVVQQAFVWSYQDVPTGWKVGQVLLAAADVDATVFSASNVTATAFSQHSGRITAYVNGYDKALLVSNSKRLDLAPRLGRVGLPPDAPSTMYEVDCSAMFEQAYPGAAQALDPVATHCFYFSQPRFWQDVVLTLGGGIDGSIIPGRTPNPLKPTPNRLVLDPAWPTDGDYRTALTHAATTPSIQL